MNIMVCLLFFVTFIHAAERKRVKFEHFVIFLALSVIAAMGIQLYQKIILHDPRPSGPFFNPNFLGEFMSVSSIVFIAMPLFGWGEKKAKFTCIVLFAVSLAAILLCKSRGAAISCLAGISVVLFFRFRWRAWALISLLLILFILIPNPVRDRVISKEDVYRYSRLNIYDAGLRIVSDHPLGIGLGNFKYYYDQYESPIYGAVSLYGKKAKTVHNEHLQVLVEQGLVGTVLYLGLVISLFLKILFTPRKGPPLLKAMACGAGISLLVHATVDSVYHTFALPFAVLAILGFYIGDAETSWFEVRPGKLAKVSLVLFTAGMVIYSGFTAGAYYLTLIGEKKAKDKEFNSAINILGTAVHGDSMNGKTREIKAAVHYRAFVEMGDFYHYRKAILEIENSIRLQERAGWLRDRKAFLLLRGIEKGVYSEEEERKILYESIRLYREQLMLDPNNVFAMKNLSILLASTGSPGEAEWILKKAVSTEPNYAKGYYLLGKMREASGRGEEARFLYKRAFSLYKKYSGLKGLEKYAEKLIMLDDQTLKDLRVKIDESS